MKLNYNYLTCAVFSIALLLTGCKKLVEIDEPIDTVTSTKIFSSDDQADQTLAGLYSQMISGDQNLLSTNGGATIYGGLASDEFKVANSVSFPEDQEFSSNKMLVDNSMSYGVLWLANYKTIYTANAILDGEAASSSPNLTKRKRIELKASAKFFRAYCYFYLSNFFGDVPLALSSNYMVTMRLPRATQSEVYAQIIKDLRECVALFSDPDAAVISTKTKVNKAAAQALLARVYLYVQDWGNAETYATDLISNTAFQLETVQKTFDPASRETILQFTIHPSSNIGISMETASLSPFVPLSALSPSDQEIFLDPGNYLEFLDFLLPKFPVRDELVNAFETGDQRGKVWLDYNGSPNVEPFFGKRTYYANKYPRNDIERTNYVLLRLAELYLIRAEARAMQNKNDLAAADLDLIRNRAGLGKITATDQQSLLTAVAQERRIELFAEWGHRFFDLKRTGRAVSVLSAIPEKQGLTASSLLFPIHSKEILANANLKQNTGY